MSRIGEMFNNIRHPIDGLRNGLSNIAAHPWQTVGRGVASAVAGPVGGQLAAALFRGYNNRQNDNAYQNTLQGTVSRGNAAAQRAMDKPLNGPLGAVPGGRGDNTGLMNALMGNYGGQDALNSGMYNMANQYRGMNPTSSSQMINSLLPGMSQNYENSPQAGGNLGIGPGQHNGANVSGPQMMNGNQFGYSQAGGGYGAGVWNGGGGMRSYQVNSGSLSPSNYSGIGGGGNYFGPFSRPQKQLV